MICAMTRFRNISIQKKILISMLAFTLIPILLVSAVAISITYKTMRDQLIYDHRMSSGWLQNRLAVENSDMMDRFYEFEVDKDVKADILRWCTQDGEYHQEIICALTRRPPLEIPAGAYDAEDIQSGRRAGSVFRRTSKATLLFADGHTGEADWRRYGGEAQPEDQRILLRLSEGDRVGYRLENPENQKIRIHVRSYGDGILDVQDLTAGQGLVWITCKSGTADVESLHIRAADDSAETI